jgi:hypothetical protein
VLLEKLLPCDCLGYVARQALSSVMRGVQFDLWSLHQTFRGYTYTRIHTMHNAIPPASRSRGCLPTLQSIFCLCKASLFALSLKQAGTVGFTGICKIAMASTSRRVCILFALSLPTKNLF